jgi:hypothetical protein
MKPLRPRHRRGQSPRFWARGVTSATLQAPCFGLNSNRFASPVYDCICGNGGIWPKVPQGVKYGLANLGTLDKLRQIA